MRRAYTLIDVLVTLAILSIVLLAALPAFNSDERTRLAAAANLVVADLNNTRALCIQNPSDPVRLVLGEKGRSYFLAYESEPGEPLELPDAIGGAYQVAFGEGDHTNLWEVVLRPEGVAEDSIDTSNAPYVTFDAFGRLVPQTDVRLEIVCGGATLTVVVRADTGDAYVE